MLDLLIKGGTVVDGTGAPARTADVAIRDGHVADIGTVDDDAARTIDADGLLVTPGFVDLHTHYDGQAIWSDRINPSSAHGVTTVVMGNCGVGFAPCRPEQQEMLVELMEGVEDIPGAALHEGLSWLARSVGDPTPLVEALVSISSVAGGVILTAVFIRLLVRFFQWRRRFRIDVMTGSAANARRDQREVAQAA